MTTLIENQILRRVVLLATDERAGLVASIADAVHSNGVSLEISTGPSHVVLTFSANDEQTNRTVSALNHVPGVDSVNVYSVLGASSQ